MLFGWPYIRSHEKWESKSWSSGSNIFSGWCVSIVVTRCRNPCSICYLIRVNVCMIIHGVLFLWNIVGFFFQKCCHAIKFFACTKPWSSAVCCRQSEFACIPHCARCLSECAAWDKYNSVRHDRPGRVTFVLLTGDDRRHRRPFSVDNLHSVAIFVSDILFVYYMLHRRLYAQNGSAERHH